MTNFGAKIFNNAVSSLSAQQAVIANAANNIANVNTEGYARRVVDLQTRLGSSINGLNIGNGVEVGGILRVNDAFLEGLTLSATSVANQNEVVRDMLGRVEDLFSLTGDTLTIGSALTDFFASLDNLSMDPASIELRSDVIERANDLTSTISSTYNTIAALQTEADDRIANELNVVNGLLEQISDMNSLIAAKESGGTSGAAADERDRRSVLMEDLAERISFDSVEGPDGAVMISLSNGFPLVSGPNFRPLELSTSPSFVAGSLPPSLEGGVLGSVVYDYDSGAGQAHLDLTATLASGGGSIGGLLQLRGVNDPANTSAFDATGSLVEVASQIEAITRDLLIGFNQTYVNYPNDADAGTGGFQSGSIDLDGNSANATNTFSFFSMSYSGVVEDPGKGAADFGAPLASDLTYIMNNSGGTVTNFSSILTLAISDPREIAAGRVATLPFVPTPEPGDNTNLEALSVFQSGNRDFSTYGVGSYTLVASYDQAYNQMVGRVGNIKARADLDYSVSETNLNTMKTRRDEISSVSLDEEFTQLIRFQKAFEANARMIRIGSELFDTITQLL